MPITHHFLDFEIDDDQIKEMALSPWIFNQLKGNNPNSWPVGLSDFHKAVSELKPLQLFNEPFELLNSDFDQKFS